TFGLVLPAFLVNEPLYTGERIEPRLGILAALGLVLFVVGTVRICRAWLKVFRLRRQWMSQGTRMGMTGASTDVYRVQNDETLIAVTGLLRPTVFVSDRVARLLEPSECEAGIAHEIAHVAARDNIKQVLLYAWQLPFLEKLTGMDAEWQLASE